MMVYGTRGLGLLLGALIGYLLGSRRATMGQSDGRLEQELRQQTSTKDAELSQIRLELAASQRGESQAQAEAAAIKDSLERERERYKSDLAELREAFKALSADALKENSAELLRQADESFKGLQEK
jgi:DNA recombination protein RmuC